LPAKSAKFPIKRHLAQPLRRSNMLNLVPLGTPYLFGAVQELLKAKGDFPQIFYIIAEPALNCV